MYHSDKVAERLYLAKEQLGWLPVEHSIDEIDSAKKSLNSLIIYKDDGSIASELKRPFTDKEKRFIRNERFRCACDANYWMTRYAYIKDEKNNVIRFSPRVPQQVYFNVISELERRNAAIQLQILKSRQLGMSTITELLVTHRICFYSGVNAVIASAAQQPTQIMSQMLFLAYDRMPFWLRPNWTRRVESDRGMMVFGGLESRVDFQHGAQQQGIGRGTTPTVIHISEVASFSNAEELIEQSLFNAVHESPSVFMILESTAEGPVGWWPKTWKYSRENWGSGARLCPLFLPWFVGVDTNPTPTWLETRPCPDNFRLEPETKEMMAKAKMFVKSQEVLSTVLGDDYEVPKDQVWYWQSKFLEAKGKGTEKSLYQEMPTDDIECFQGEFDSVFGRDLIAEINTQRKKEYQIFGIVGEGIQEQHEPYSEEIDYEKDFKIVRYKGNKEKSYTWRFIPLKEEYVNEKEYESVDNKLLIFHEPQPGIDYCVGIDTGYGKGADASAINVWAMGKEGMPDIQVAEYASAMVSHIEVYPFAIAISAYYSKFMGEGIHKEPMISPEMLAAWGDSMILQMRNMGYSRFFRFTRWDKKKLSKKNATQIGFMSTSWSRPVLVENFVYSVKNKIAEIHSPFLLAEMDKFEIHSTKTGRQKLEHSSDSHDDRIISSALSILTYHEMHPMVERGKNRYTPPSHNEKPLLSFKGFDDSINVDTFDYNFSERMKHPQQLEDYISNERFNY